MTKNTCHNMAACGSDGDADAELSSSLRSRPGDNTVNSDRCEEQSQGTRPRAWDDQRANGDCATVGLRGGRALLCRWLAVRIGRHRRARSDDERPARSQRHLAHRLDCLAVVLAVLLELGEVVIKGKMNDTVGLGRSVAQAVEVLDVALMHLGSRLSQRFGPGL